MNVRKYKHSWSSSKGQFVKWFNAALINASRKYRRKDIGKIYLDTDISGGEKGESMLDEAFSQGAESVLDEVVQAEWDDMEADYMRRYLDDLAPQSRSIL